MIAKELYTFLQTNPYALAGLIGLPILIIIWRLITADSFYPGIEVYGVGKSGLTYTKAKQHFSTSAREILINGARECQKGFQVVTQDGPRIIFPSRYASEIGGIKSLSFREFMRRDLFTHIPGFEAHQVGGIYMDVIVDTLRIKLTQSLYPITFDQCQEADVAVNELFGNNRDQWVEFNTRNHANNVVARLSTLALLGKDLCRDRRWLDVAVDYTLVLAGAQRALRRIPKFAQPFIHWFMPECQNLRKVSQYGRSLIAEEIGRRAAQGYETKKVSDSLGWMQELANGVEIDFAGAQLLLTVAAIHTTSDLLIKCLYNLCIYPEYQSAIREEIASTLKERGWNKNSMYCMKLLDSFMKETQRLAPVSFSTMSRIAMENVTLKDGTVIPKNAGIKVIQDSSFNPSIYPDPEKFDGYRFVKLRSQPDQENHWQLVTTSPEHLGFGHGIHRCPGRFFASNQVKVMLSFLLLRYEWRRESPQEMPPSFAIGLDIIANPMFKVSFKRREAEFDILSIVK